MNVAIVSRVKRIMSDIFSVPVERITLESSPDTIDAWDSLQHLNLMLALEQEFGLKIAPEEMERLVSVHDMVIWVGEKLQAARPV